mmetsp:Transcript_23064/g.40817  ORF Transcript_23064/g.40817 Transcript_23064/m.40817 type:complete len:356 (-) Transcript_23064:265-1332(-)
MLSELGFKVGLLISFTASFLNSVRPPLQKHLGQKIRHPLLQQSLKGILQVPMHVLAVLILDKSFLPTSIHFYTAVFVNAVLNFTAENLMAYALQLAPLSHTVPFSTLSLPFLVVTSSVILGEHPSLQGALGVLLMCAGAFYLNSIKVTNKSNKHQNHSNGSSISISKGSKSKHSNNGGLRQRVNGHEKDVSEKEQDGKGNDKYTKASVRQGTLLALSVAGLWSLSSPLDKVAMRYGSPLQFSMVTTFMKCVINNLLLASHKRNTDPKILEKEMEMLPGAWFYVVASALASGVGYVLHTTGAQNIPIVYNSSIRRLGMVVSVLYGAIVFREANLTKTLGASFIMLFGVMLIVSQPK